MSLARLFGTWLRPGSQGRKRRPIVKRRLNLEVLEERSLLAVGLGSRAVTLINPPPTAPPPIVSSPPGDTGSSPPPTTTNPPPGDGGGSTSPPPSTEGATYALFLTKLYQDVLHRSAAPGEIAAWSSALSAGQTFKQVATAFGTSAEYRSDFIREQYRIVLGRDPAPAEVNGWLGPMQAGLSEKQLVASFLASDEFYFEQGGTNEAWLNGVYAMVLRRGADGAGMSGWMHAMQANPSRVQAALGFLNSGEANGLMVGSAYSTYLQREAGAGEAASWVRALPPATSGGQLMPMIVSAPEYLSVAQNFAELSATSANISGITPDTGVSSSDGITNVPNITVKGTGTTGASFVVAVDNAPSAWGRAAADGTWSVSLSRPLGEGAHTITVRVANWTGSFSSLVGYTAVVDLTAPTVTVQASNFTGNPNPAVTVTAADANGISSHVTVDVDVQHSGTFNDPGDLGLATGTLAGGTTTIPLTGLAPGAYMTRAGVEDVAGNVGTSVIGNLQINASGAGITNLLRLKTDPQEGPPIPTDPNIGFVGSQALTDLFTGYSQIVGGSSTLNGSGPPPTGGLSGLGAGTSTGAARLSMADFIKAQSHYYVFDASNDVLVRVRLRSRAFMEQAASDLKDGLGMTIAQVFPQQYTIEGYLPVGNLLQLATVTDFGAVTPVYAAIHNIGAVTTQGDATVHAGQFRAAVGKDGAGITIGAISDSVNQVDNAGDGNADKGIAESQRTGDLPAAGVNVLQDGSATATDEGRAMLEIVHDIAPGASLAFTTADQGPQAMAQGIVDLATKAGAKVIVDDVSYPDEPFFNDGLVAQAVNQVVAQNDVLYVTSAGNEADHAWVDSYRPVNATLGGISGAFTNFDSGSGTNLLQQFTLQPSQTLDLSFQWDSPFLEGGSPLKQFQVTNSLAARVLDGSGTKILKSFADVNQNTGEALQRVIFTNDGSYGINTFALAFQHMSGPDPTMLKWVRFDSNAAAQYQGAPAIWGHAAASGALTVGAVPFGAIQNPEPFTSQGTATILFDNAGNRLAKPEVRNKPDVAGPDGVWTANFPALPAGQSLPPGNFPIFTGTSAAAAHVAGVAALLRQSLASSPATAIDDAMIKAAVDVGPAGWDPQTGAGLVQIDPSASAAAVLAGQLNVGPNRDISHSIKRNADAGGSKETGSSILLNKFPNVDTTKVANNEWEEDIGVDPTNPNRIFLASNQDTSRTGLFASRSSDGGVTWTGKIIADGSDSLTKACCDPSVSWDQFGNLFLAYLNNTDDRAVIALSTDGGATFTELAKFTAKDQPKVTTGAGAVWLVYNNSDVEATGAPVTGLGAVGKFGTPQGVPGSNGGNFGTIAIAPGGQVLVSYQDSGSGSGPDTIMTALDPDGLGAAGFNNATGATGTTVGSFRSITPQPKRTIDADGRIAFDRSTGPHAGRVYLDYVDAPDTKSNDTNIFVRSSDDLGLTWSPPVRVNDDNGANSQFWPRLAVDQTTGNIAVSWYDCRNDIGSGPGDTNGKPNDDTEFFATVSADGGASFLPNVQIAQGPSSAIANDNNTNEYGDYTGLAFFGGNFYPAWADNSNSTGDNPDGKLSGFDVMTTKGSFSGLASLAIGQDGAELNQTSDKAINEGALLGSAGISGLGISRLPNGLPDYDWFRWSAGQAGTFTATLTINAHQGDLELHIFTVSSNDTLIDLGDATAPGATTRVLRTHLTADEPILVEVKGRMYLQGLFGRGIYDLSVSMS